MVIVFWNKYIYIFSPFLCKVLQDGSTFIVGLWPELDVHITVVSVVNIIHHRLLTRTHA